MIHYNRYADGERTLPILFFAACTDHPQEYIRRSGACHFHQIMVVVDGTGFLKCGGNTYELKRGCAFFTSKTTPVEYYGTELVTAFVAAVGPAVDTMMDFYGSDGFLFYESVNVDPMVADINRIISGSLEDRPAGFLSGLTYAFYTDFFELRNRSATALDRIVTYIEKNFMKKLTLAQLAAIGSMSVSKLSHDFKRRFGVSVFEYILDLRLNYARAQLVFNPNLTTKEAAFSCGFDDVSYFCRAYKEKFSRTPGEERKAAGGRPAPDVAQEQ